MHRQGDLIVICLWFTRMEADGMIRWHRYEGKVSAVADYEFPGDDARFAAMEAQRALHARMNERGYDRFAVLRQTRGERIIWAHRVCGAAVAYPDAHDACCPARSD